MSQPNTGARFEIAIDGTLPHGKRQWFPGGWTAREGEEKKAEFTRRRAYHPRARSERRWR
jgi:hypothetical protein